MLPDNCDYACRVHSIFIFHVGSFIFSPNEMMHCCCPFTVQSCNFCFEGSPNVSCLNIFSFASTRHYHLIDIHLFRNFFNGIHHVTLESPAGKRWLKENVPQTIFRQTTLFFIQALTEFARCFAEVFQLLRALATLFVPRN